MNILFRHWRTYRRQCVIFSGCRVQCKWGEEIIRRYTSGARSSTPIGWTGCKMCRFSHTVWVGGKVCWTNSLIRIGWNRDDISFVCRRFYIPVPEQLQLRIAFWSFPEHEEDIRLYSCLANGAAEEFQKGEKLFKNDCVSDILQIGISLALLFSSNLTSRLTLSLISGFHLSATVKPSMREAHKVAVTFDRRRITTCTCSCNSVTNWCGHVVAVCLNRIFQVCT